MRRRETPRWSRLDNAAKIFSSNSTVRDSKVFRFVCELQEPVDPETLQEALDRTMVQFPLYRSVLKRGFFWYYFEESELRPEVRPEEQPPCLPVYSKYRRSLLFRVLYYDRRISLEVFHAMSDGTGALQVLRTLVWHYLLLRYPEAFPGPPPELAIDASHTQMGDDSFQKYYEKPAGAFFGKQRTAYRVRGARQAEDRLCVVEGCMPLEAALGCARASGVTLTELMTAVLILAIRDGMRLRERHRPVVISVPVNLRSYFPSASARNLFATINVSCDLSRQEATLEAVCACVHQCFLENLTEEQLRERMNRLCALEHSLPMRLVPLALKDPILRTANWHANRKITAAFSNVGKVSMPEEMAPYIRQFSVFTSPNKIQASACSYRDRYVVGFAGPFRDQDVERAFFRCLTGLGLDAVITTNLQDRGVKDAIL